MQSQLEQNAAAASARSSSEPARLAELEREIAAGLPTFLRGRSLDAGEAARLADACRELAALLEAQPAPEPESHPGFVLSGQCECPRPDPDGIGVCGSCGLELGWRPTVRRS